MPVINNIFNIKINNVASNGSVNFGNAAFDGNNVNFKSQGMNTTVGDASPQWSPSSNWANDSDFNDQVQSEPEVASPSVNTAGSL
ncbi:spore germination protein [Alkalihalobacillus sp. BA299]|uniref:spore germination protein n=1 Tax=Alkalihalobacillus sp. BA299 TaxID=2815938 RepID=UPI001FFE185A|nr:spore germination protein [Alkalihalobacillus sp. BA299]